MSAPLAMPGCLGMFKFLLFFVIQVDGSFYPKTGLVCQMMSKLSCDGSFISKINIACSNQRNAAVTHGNKCSRNEDCITWDSVCFKGVCLCKLGHYFSRGQNTCIKECSKYEKKMDGYKGVGIDDHNNKELRKPNLASCEEACVEEETFICVTVEYYLGTGQCLLSIYGYLDVEKTYREFDSIGWILSQRQCI